MVNLKIPKYVPVRYTIRFENMTGNATCCVIDGKELNPYLYDKAGNLKDKPGFNDRQAIQTPISE